MMMKIHRNLLVLGGAVSPLGKESSSVNLFSPLISVFPVGIVHLNNGSIAVKQGRPREMAR